ncbi:putative reverse transcriptase domain-containing protein [Tanacetum coccineum]|uniref:Reverse transcriptase domain-containing protein n=1 Tax=Tanacetum coccineum TaxID=301880 RepID=A0ABQ5BBS5_9ASTR
MAPTTRRGPNTPVNDTNPNNMTPESIQAMIDQALLRNSTNGDGSHSSHGDNRRNVQTVRPCFYADFMKCQPLNFKGAEVKGNDVPAYTERFQELTLICTKFVANETEKVDKYISGLPDNIYGNVKSAGNRAFVANETEKVDKYLSGFQTTIYWKRQSRPKPKTLDETIELANDLMDRKLLTYAERQSEQTKGGLIDSYQNRPCHQQQPFKRQNVAKVYNMGTGERKPYGGSLPKCNKCHLHHNGPCTQRCHKCNKDRTLHGRLQEYINTNVANTQKGNGAAPKGNGCFECGAPGYFKRDCPKLKNKDGGNGNAQGNGLCSWEWKKRGEMAPGNPMRMSSRLKDSHAVIVCDEKLVQVPYGNETLTFCGNEGSNGRESRLSVISCSKAQEYMAKGCQSLFSNRYPPRKRRTSRKETERNVPTSEIFQKCFPRTWPGPLPPARPVEFQIDLIPGAAPVARAPYRLAPSKMKELSEQLHKSFRQGFIRPIPLLRGAPCPVLICKKKDGSFRDVQSTKPS